MVATRILDLSDIGLFVAALHVVIRHNWPFYLGFRGGKGVATVFEISLAVLPALTVVSAVIAIVFGLIARNVIFGVSVAFIALNAVTVITYLILSGIIVITHFSLAYRSMLASVRSRGVWGLFEVG